MVRFSLDSVVSFKSSHFDLLYFRNFMLGTLSVCLQLGFGTGQCRLILLLILFYYFLPDYLFTTLQDKGILKDALVFRLGPLSEIKIFCCIHSFTADRDRCW